MDRQTVLKSNYRNLLFLTAGAFSIGAVFSALCTDSFAAPTGGSVTGGAAVILQSGTTTTINQSTNRAVIDWRGFDINSNELVRFNQPGAGSIALNRISGGSPTSILGQLTANGRVFISNPSGIVFGAGSKVDVAGLLATTFGISNADFMSGKMNFVQDAAVDPSLVINSGEIRVTDNGFCFLVAPGVKNEGLIVAQLGKVVMASGSAMTIDFNGDGLLTYNVSGKVMDSVKGPDGKPFNASVQNDGTISASGGHVVLAGNAAREAFSSVVNNSGIIEARSLVSSGGKVTLSGGDEGIVLNSGTINVSSAEAGAASGEVSLGGQYVGNFGNIQARGETGSDGGTVRFDSTVHTLLADSSLIDVSGVDNSSAGSVLLRSDNHTTFQGSILARGGDSAGDGGFVDVSSKGQVDLLGNVDASAPSGKIGTLLIDPKNIVIDAAGAFANNLFANNIGGNTTISAANINSQISNVVLQANTDITVTSAINIANNGTALTMQAGRSVLINNNVATNNGTISITANDPAATALDRTAGPGSITAAAGTSISSGNAPITLTVGSGSEPGGITVDTVTSSNTVSMNSVGTIQRSAGGSGVVSGSTINMNVTGASSTVGAESAALKVDAATLNVTTAGGSALLGNVDGNVALGAINVGSGTLILSATNGSITAAAGATPNITASTVNLTTDGLLGGAIGTQPAPLRTDIGSLTASTSNGGVYISEVNGLLVNSVTARESLSPGVESGVAPSLNGSGQVVLSGSILGIPVSRAGTYDVEIAATGDISLGTVSAPRVATVSSGTGSIIDLNMSSNNIIAITTNITAAGSVGQSTDPIEVMTEALNGNATSGSYYLDIASPGRIGTITAGTDVVVNQTSGALRIGTVNAGHAATISNSSGALLDENGATVNITAPEITLTGKTGIGTLGDALDTAASSKLTTNVTDSTMGTYVANTGNPTVLVKTNSGNTVVSSNGGLLSYVYSSGAFSSTTGNSITFENAGVGDLALGSVNAGSGDATLIALAGIKDNGSLITAGTATLQAGAGIGTSVNRINTNVDSLNANSKSGGIYISEASGLTLDASAAGAGSDVNVTNSSGNILVSSVKAVDQVVLNAAGDIASAIPSATAITAAGATLSAGGAVGSSGSPINGLLPKACDALPACKV